MLTNDVYQLKGELDRLAAQNLLFREAECGTYAQILQQYPQARVLDIGCNNGTKLVNRFSYPAIEQVVGLEFHGALAQQAQAQFGNQHYAFYQCDVEDASLLQQLEAIMTERGIEVFDIVHISLVLLHLKNPAAVLNTLRKVLSPQGQLLIVEPADNTMVVSPDPLHLRDGFVAAMEADPYSGNRNFVHSLPQLLQDCGYENIAIQPQIIFGDATAWDRKALIFEIICSFLEEDAQLAPEDAPWKHWVADHFAQFEHLIKEEESQITVELHMITCSPKEVFFRPVEQEDVPRVLALCHNCAGKNLYTQTVFYDAVALPNHYIYLLQTQKDELVGYVYFKLVDVQAVADYAKFSPDVFEALGPLPTGRIVQLQTIGVDQAYRYHRYSQLMQDFAIESADEGDGIFAMCWRPAGKEPVLGPSLAEHGFLHIANCKDVWADVPDLVCPYCQGPCHCEGAAYYRPKFTHQKP